ncbi:MAG TPA: hypothetical protein VK711_16795 [Puia sp.]|jgi:hypothetical protein|nr:hypothetical protein [Puia sp.]
MKTFLAIGILCSIIFCAKAQTDFPTKWQPDMQLLMYTTPNNSVPNDTVYIGVKSSVVTNIPGHADKKDFTLSPADLDDLLITFHKFNITGIHTEVLFTGKDTWTNYLILKWADKQISVTFGRGLAIPDPNQKNNLDSINSFINDLLFKTGQFNLDKM